MALSAPRRRGVFVLLVGLWCEVIVGLPLAKADLKVSYSAMLLYVFCRRLELMDHQTYTNAPEQAVRGMSHQINADTRLGYLLPTTIADLGKVA